jgi:hypothetical protein
MEAGGTLNRSKTYRQMLECGFCMAVVTSRLTHLPTVKRILPHAAASMSVIAFHEKAGRSQVDS